MQDQWRSHKCELGGLSFTFPSFFPPLVSLILARPLLSSLPLSFHLEVEVEFLKSS